MFKCPNCGGELEYLPGTEIIKCEFCDSKFTPEELGIRREVVADEHKQEPVYEEPLREEFDATAYICPQCGGEILSTQEAAVTFCSYCGSQVTLQSRLVKLKKPDYIIPFKIPEDECKKAYIRKLRGAIFAPSSMKKDTQIKKFRGIYMPYWVYDVKSGSKLSIKSHTDRRSGNYIIHDNYTTTMDLEGSVNGIAFDASSVFSDELSGAIAPYDISEAREFTPAYISSFYADQGDVDAGIYVEDANFAAGEAIAKSVVDSNMRNVGMTESDVISAFTSTKIDEKIGYYPVWFLAARNKKQDRVSYAVINGQTGKLAVDLPVDFLKYIIGALIIAVPIFVVLTMFVTMTPKILAIIVVLLSLLALLVANAMLNTVYRRKGMLDDIGLASRDSKKTAEIKKYRDKAREAARAASKKKSSAGAFIATTVFTFFIMMSVGVTVVGSFLGGFVLWGVITIVRLIFQIASQSSRNINVKVAAPFKDKIGTMWKCCVGMVLCGAVFILNPIEDFLYYGAAIVAIILAAWTVFDIIKAHNQLTTRTLPQFGKRGGDENAY